MSSLKEIKGRIASVNSTLKITSAMKMVASAKLKMTQKAMGNMLPYHEKLNGILTDLLADTIDLSSEQPQTSEFAHYICPRGPVSKVALVVISSNSSLCGGYNASVIKEANNIINEYENSGVEVTLFTIGRRIAEALRKAGREVGDDHYSLSGNPAFEASAKFGQQLIDGFVNGDYDKVEFVYNHFKSNASQPTVRDVLLPITIQDQAKNVFTDRYIVEPDRSQLLKAIIPETLRLKVYSILLDAAVAEHVARTVAMQIATDNGNSLLVNLTLEYNKSRQQKITSEILELESSAI